MLMIRNADALVKLDPHETAVLSFYRETLDEQRQRATRWIQKQLDREVDRWLGRKWYQRCNRRSGRRLRVYCSKCGSTYQRDFWRNGYRQRFLLTLLGVLTIWIPRVRCRCGGSVSIPFTVLKPRQRIWGDLRLQIQRWGEWRVSLRMMQQELSLTVGTSIGLQTVNNGLLAAPGYPPGKHELTTVPPVVMLDAAWHTLLTTTGRHQLDTLGRRRAIKRKQRSTVLIALGIWPRTGSYYVLDWDIAAGESAADWSRLLDRLIDRRLWKVRGLQLFIHDGGSGLRAALASRYGEVPSQRCVFHKLRNVRWAVEVPEEATPTERRAIRQRLMGQAAAVFQAPDAYEAQNTLAEFRHDWQTRQPAAVDTMLRDLDDTLRFHEMLERNPNWQAKAIRTTSVLERVNGILRPALNAAGAHHSTEGLDGCIRRNLSPLVIR